MSIVNLSKYPNDPDTYAILGDNPPTKCFYCGDELPKSFIVVWASHPNVIALEMECALEFANQIIADAMGVKKRIWHPGGQHPRWWIERAKDPITADQYPMNMMLRLTRETSFSDALFYWERLKFVDQEQKDKAFDTLYGAALSGGLRPDWARYAVRIHGFEKELRDRLIERGHIIEENWRNQGRQTYLQGQRDIGIEQRVAIACRRKSISFKPIKLLRQIALPTPKVGYRRGN